MLRVVVARQGSRAARLVSAQATTQIDQMYLRAVVAVHQLDRGRGRDGRQAGAGNTAVGIGSARLAVDEVGGCIAGLVGLSVYAIPTIDAVASCTNMYIPHQQSWPGAVGPGNPEEATSQY